MIKLQVIGNVGRDADVKEINGRRAINFSVAHNRKYKTQDGTEVESTVWVGCTIWRDAKQGTEIAKHLTMGTRVFVEGVPGVQLYKNKEGQHSASIQLQVTNIELLGGRKENEPAATTSQTAAAPAAEFVANNQGDDLPF